MELKAAIVVLAHKTPYICHKPALETCGTVAFFRLYSSIQTIAYALLWRKNRFDKCLVLLLLLRRPFCRYTKAVFRLNGILSYLRVVLFWKALKFPRFSFPNNLTNEYAVFWLQNVPRVCYFVKFWNYYAMFCVSCELMEFSGLKTLFRYQVRWN